MEIIPLKDKDLQHIYFCGSLIQLFQRMGIKT